MEDSKIETDGALYVGQNYYWESAGFYWSVYKPSSANDDRYNFNKFCDNNASVEKVTEIVNKAKLYLDERQQAYVYFSETIK